MSTCTGRNCSLSESCDKKILWALTQSLLTTGLGSGVLLELSLPLPFPEPYFLAGQAPRASVHFHFMK